MQLSVESIMAAYHGQARQVLDWLRLQNTAKWLVKKMQYNCVLSVTQDDDPVYLKWEMTESGQEPYTVRVPKNLFKFTNYKPHLDAVMV